jgi:hypothetical protein
MWCCKMYHWKICIPSYRKIYEVKFPYMKTSYFCSSVEPFSLFSSAYLPVIWNRRPNYLSESRGGLYSSLQTVVAETLVLWIPVYISYFIWDYECFNARTFRIPWPIWILSVWKLRKYSRRSALCTVRISTISTISTIITISTISTIEEVFLLKGVN